ncbi:hypothetical protein ACFL1G_04440 [Planctomycetota bacterium]
MYGKQKTLLFFSLAVTCIGIVACALPTNDRGNSQSETLPNVTRLKPLMHKGKPFFPIGAYERTRPATGRGFVPLSTLRNAGWNTILFYAGDDVGQYLDEAEEEGFAVILSVEKLVKEQKQTELHKGIEKVKDHRALLGYYIFDEPENVYYNSKEYKSILASRNNDDLKELSYFINSKIGWAKPLIRNADPNPEHYIFMCIAWWNQYRKLSSLCDINMPNEYPTKNTTSEFEGSQARIVYDAKLAAKAAYESGGMGFCYTPFAVNIGLENHRYPTVNEFRYSAFAPITQGAMGIVFWAGYRCKLPYAERVVFPVTRRLNSLKQFFLGDWLDEKLRCESSETATALLEKLELPVVSGCLRQHDDGRYLLLAVNNTAKLISATFHVDVNSLPNQAQEYIKGDKVAINNGVIEDKMDPYGVCAYIIGHAN